MEQNEGNTYKDERPTVDPDTEVWIQNTVKTAMRMAVAVTKEKKVGADEAPLEYALDGIAEGTAIELIRLLHYQPGYVNIKNLHPPTRFALVKEEG